jgi:hypothetical protein
MIQPQWPGLGPTFPSPTIGGNLLGTGGTGMPNILNADGVGSSWWNQTTANPNGVSSTEGGSAGSLGGMLQQLLGLVGQLVGALTGSGSGGLGTSTGMPGYGAAPGTPGCGNTPWTTQGPQGGWTQQGGPQQRFSDVDISSTGDPHIAETGTRETRGGTQSVDQHYDSMTAHGDLVSSSAVAGGYRVSTTVTQPNANGVTYNNSATVHANGGGDSVTMQHDGSFSITSGGQPLALSKGQTVTLSGGETVAENADGSLVVNAANQNGGSIATTLRSNGNGVDVTTHAHELALGGDVVQHGQQGQQTPPPITAPLNPPAF